MVNDFKNAGGIVRTQQFDQRPGPGLILVNYSN